MAKKISLCDEPSVCVCSILNAALDGKAKNRLFEYIVAYASPKQLLEIAEASFGKGFCSIRKEARDNLSRRAFEWLASEHGLPCALHLNLRIRFRSGSGYFEDVPLHLSGPEGALQNRANVQAFQNKFDDASRRAEQAGGLVVKWSSDCPDEIARAADALRLAYALRERHRIGQAATEPQIAKKPPL